MSGSLVSWAALGAANVSFCEARLDGSVAEPANAWSSAVPAPVRPLPAAVVGSLSLAGGAS